MTARRWVPGALFLLAALAAFPVLADTRVRCESKGGRRVCPVENIGRVEMRRQLSIASCTEELTWGYTSDAIWVDNGCRAEFDVFTRRSRDDWNDDRRNDRDRDRDRDRSGGSRLICESANGRRNFCAADVRYGVELVRTLSRRACVEGENWGYDDRGVWVDDGCRAEFFVREGRRGGRDDRGRSAHQTLVCESDYNRRHDCPADTRYGVELKRQISRTECVFNRTWGYNRDGVWVANGCRAEFQIRGW